jgi:hypothetical protein
MHVLDSGELADVLVYVGEPSIVILELRFPTQKLYHRAVNILHAQWGKGAREMESSRIGTNRSQNN